MCRVIFFFKRVRCVHIVLVIVTCESITTPARLRKPPRKRCALALRRHFVSCCARYALAATLALRALRVPTCLRCAPLGRWHYGTSVAARPARPSCPRSLPRLAGPTPLPSASPTLRSGDRFAGGQPQSGFARCALLHGTSCPLAIATAVARPLRVGGGRASPPPGLFRKIKKSASPTASLFFHFFEKTRRLPQFGYQKAR